MHSDTPGKIPDWTLNTIEMNNTRHSEVDILKSLKQRGYTHNFLVRNGRLYAHDYKGIAYKPSQCLIEVQYRFEGFSNPSDMSIVYGIRTNDNKRGSLVVAYGPKANFDVAEFIRRVPEVISSNPGPV